MASNSVEREVKLGASSQFTVPDLRDLVKRTVRLPEQKLLADYYDTPEHRLWAQKITLRHRIVEDEGIGTWTMKLPESGSGLTVDRTELDWVGSRDTVPDRVHEVLRGIVRRASLQRITSLETIRRRLILEGRLGIQLAELDDDVVTIRGGAHDGGRFRQIEVELGEADDVLLKNCIDRLCAAGAWIDDRGPKLARAIDAEIGDGAKGPVLGPKSTMADVVRVSIITGFNRILDSEYRLRLNQKDPPPDAIHQTRVATRRLRSDLQTFNAVLDPLWIRHTRDDLKWLGGELGRVRDVDVLGQHLDLSGSHEMGDTKGRYALRQQLQGQRQTAAEEVAAVLESDRYLLLLDKLHAAAGRPPFLDSHTGASAGIRTTSRASKKLPKVVKRPWKKLRKVVQNGGHGPSDRQLHEIRIGAKRLRYAAEAAEAVVGKEARRVASAAEELQSYLGEHHDAVIAESWLRKRAKLGPTRVAFVAGILASEQIRRQQNYREGWLTAWETLDRRANRWLG